MFHVKHDGENTPRFHVKRYKNISKKDDYLLHLKNKCDIIIRNIITNCALFKNSANF